MNNTAMNEMERLRESAKETIYLIPDSDEGRLIYLWCDHPAPTDHHIADEAVEYVRRDIYDAALDREESLAAKLGSYDEAYSRLTNTEVINDYWERCLPPSLLGDFDRIFESSPLTSLARRDLIKQAEALESIASKLYWQQDVDAVLCEAVTLRQRAQALK